MNNIEIKQLNYFIQVASLLNINETARQLGISQPAVTRQIQQIEESVGMVLFRRSPSGLKLTPAGENFHQRALEFVRDYQQSIQHSHSVHRASEGIVILGVDSGMFLGSIGFGRLLADFRKNYPRFEVRPVDILDDEGTDTLLSRDIDLLLTMRGHPSHLTESIDSDIIEGVRTEVIVKNDHPFSKKKKLQIEDLHDMPVILFDEECQPGFQNDLRQNFERKRSRLRVVQRASTETTLLGYVSAGLGLAIATGGIIELASEELSAVELRGLSLTSPTRVQVLTRRTESYPALDAFRNHLITVNTTHRKNEETEIEAVSL